MFPLADHCSNRVWTNTNEENFVVTDLNSKAYNKTQSLKLCAHYKRASTSLMNSKFN